MAVMLESDDENVLLAEVEQKIEKYSKVYKEELEMFSESFVGRAMGTKMEHIYGLGSMLESFDRYFNKYVKNTAPAHMVENKNRKVKSESASLNDLGVLPRLGHDLILAQMGANPINVFAGVQPLKSSNGDVYVKQLLSANARGNVTQGQILASPLQQPEVYSENWASANNGEVTIGTTASSSPSAGPYTSTLANAPLLKNRVKVFVNASIYGQDDGNGYIIGRGLEGTIDYDSGDIEINFTTATIPTSTAIKVNYTSNLEESGAYAKVQFNLTKINLQAKPFVVGQEFGLIQTWEMEEMFGRILADESMVDMTQAMMHEISNELILKMYRQVVADGASNLTEWDAQGYVATSTSEALHRITLNFAFAKAGKKLYSRTGRATIDVMIGDPTFCSYAETLEGFKKINVVAQGVHIYGTLDNVVILRAPQLPDGEAIFIHNGTGMFDKPCVWGVYMPMVFLHPNIPVPNNVLRVQGAAVSYGAVDLVIPRFITRFKINNP